MSSDEIDNVLFVQAEKECTYPYVRSEPHERNWTSLLCIPTKRFATS